MKIRVLVVTILVFQLTKAQDSNQQKKTVHFSVVHSVSNHSIESKINTYKFSFNLLTGKVGSIRGFELGGVYNQNIQNMSGLQVSGILNQTKNEVNGMQLAGISNISRNTNGIQTAGLVNIAKDFKGIQISGIYNQVKMLKGLQISLINVVDSIEKGGTIGLINIVKNGGYREWEISTADYQNIGISYKAGGKHIFSILSAGYNFSSKPLMVYGFGVGSSIDLSSKWKFRPELIWNTYLDESFRINPNTNAAHLKFGLMRKLSDKVAITFMPSFFITSKEKKGETYGYEVSTLKPFSSKIKGESLRETGFGLAIGISFLK